MRRHIKNVKRQATRIIPIVILSSFVALLAQTMQFSDLALFDISSLQRYDQTNSSLAAGESAQADTFGMCSSEEIPVFSSYLDFSNAGGSFALENCELDSLSFMFIGETTDSLKCPETIVRMYSISDLCGNTDTSFQTLTIKDTLAPQITSPGNSLNICSLEETPSFTSLVDFLNAGGQVSDNCQIDLVSFRLISEESDNNYCPETVTRIYQIADVCGNTDTCHQQIVISETEKPIMSSPGDIATTCLPEAYETLAEFLAAGGNVTDNCNIDTSSFMMIDETHEIHGCPETLVRIYKIADVCGNQDTCLQRIVVEDREAPFLESPADILDACSLASAGRFQTLSEFLSAGGKATDNCSIDPNSFMLISEVSDNQRCPETVSRMYQIADLCGNTDTCLHQIFIDDREAPLLESPGDITVACPIDSVEVYETLSEFVAAGGDTSDNCGIDPSSFTFIGEFSDGMRCPETVTRLYQITDHCGNTDTSYQHIIIHDKEMPVFSAPPELSVECSINQVPPFISLDEFITAGGVVNDNCGIDPLSFILISETSNDQKCPEIFTRVYQISDLCGNVDTCRHTIIVHDKIAPNLTGNNQNLYLCRLEDMPPYRDFAEFLSDGGNVRDYCKIDSSSFRLIGELTGDKRCPLTITRIYAIEDFCGNIGTFYQDLIVNDTIKPEIVAPGSIIVTCSSEEVAVYTTLHEFISAGGSVQDNCEVDSSSFRIIGEMSDNMYCPEIVTRIYQISDKCGNIDTCHHHIMIHDTEGPVIHSPGDLITTCSISEFPVYDFSGFITAGGSVSDNCGINFSTFNLISQTSDHRACPETITRVYQIADFCGNVDTCIQRILINDLEDPLLKSPGDLIATCSLEEIPPYMTMDEFIVAGGNASDNCGIDIQSFRLISEESNGQKCPEIVTRIYQIADLCGNVDTCVQRIMIDDGELPILKSPGDLMTVCSVNETPSYGTLADFIIAGGIATDNCGIDAQSFRLVSEWSDNRRCPETVTRIYEISDLCGNADTCLQRIVIFDMEPPSLRSPGDLTVTCSLEEVKPYETLTKFVAAGGNARDNCGIDIQSFRLVSEWSDNRLCPETVTRVYQISDHCGNIDTCVQRIVIDDVTPPLLVSPGDRVATCSIEEIPPYETLNKFLTSGGKVSDNCGIDDLSFTLVSESNDGNRCPETVTRVYRISDLCGNIDTCVQRIVIDDVTPPLLESPGDLVATCSIEEIPPYGTLSEFINAGGTTDDNCGIDVESFRLVSEESENRKCPETITRVYQITDLCGNVDTCIQRISIDDSEPPLLKSPGDLEVTCSLSETPTYRTLVEFITAGGVAIDNCGIDEESFRLISEESDNRKCPETVTRVYQITDLCGNVDTCIQRIRIDDRKPPSLRSPGDLAAICSAAELPAYKTIVEFIIAGGIVNDNCGIDVESFRLISEESDNRKCPETVTRVYQITDLCGNMDTCVQRIRMNDLTPPVLRSPGDLMAICSIEEIPPYSTFTEFIAAGGTANDNCGIDVESFRLVSEESDEQRCPETVIRIYQITDLCGNTDTCRQQIIIEDKGSPAMIPPPDVYMNVAISDYPPFGSLTEFIEAGGQVSDNCILDSSSFMLFAEQLISDNCPDTIVRVYSISDICNNTITCQQTIFISDPTLPEFDSPRSLEYVCFSEVPQPYPNLGDFLLDGGDARDNYKLDSSSFRIAWTDTLGICPTVISRTYEVADWCGNWETARQEITIHDLEPPQMSCPSFSFFLCNHEPAPEPYSTLEEFIAAGGTATDNCGIDTGSFEFVMETFDGDCPVSIYRTYRIKDLCGNSVTCQQFIRGEKNCPNVNCYSSITLTLGLDCEVVLEPGMFLTNPFIPLVFSDYVWLTTTVDNSVIPDNTLRFGHVGKQITVKINANLPGCGNSTCESRITLLLEKAPFIENTLHRTVYCTDTFLSIDPGSDNYPKPDAYSSCGFPVEGPEFVTEWIEFYDCPLGEQDTSKIIYREWEAYSKEGIRTVAYDTIIVLRLPPISQENIWCQPVDTIYCGAVDNIGPFMIIPDADPGDGESVCDTVYFIDNMGNPLFFDEKCRISTHVTKDTLFNENNCEIIYKYRVEVKQDCYGSPEMQCESLPNGDFGVQGNFDITGEIGVDAIYFYCEFYVHDLDTTPPVVICTTDNHFTKILSEDADCDGKNDKVFVISSDQGSCEAHTFLPPVCVTDVCRGIKTVKARIEGVGTFIYQESTVVCTITGNKKGFLFNSVQRVKLPQRSTPYEVVIEAVDQCHLIGYDTCFIWVKDGSPPVAVANKGVNLNLTTKKAWVSAETFNEGSTDNCGISLIMARRDNWQEACINLCYNHKDKSCEKKDSILISALTPIWSDGYDTLWCIDLEEFKKCDSIESHYASILEWLQYDGVPGGHLLYNSWQYSLIKYASQVCRPGHYPVDDDYIHNLIVKCAKEGGLDSKFLFPGAHPKIPCPDSGQEDPVFGFNGLTDNEIAQLLEEYAQIGGGWSNKVPFECADRCKNLGVDLLVVDFWGNWGRSRSTIWIEDITQIAVEKAVANGEISCKSFREKKWSIGNTIGLSLEDITLLARNGDRNANAFLDQLFGSYWKVWKDGYGNLINNDGKIITDEDCLINYEDYYCIVKVDTHEFIKYDPDHNITKWVTVYDTSVVYETTLKTFQNGLISVGCDAEHSSKTWVDLGYCGDGTIHRTFKIWSGCDKTHIPDTIVRHQEIRIVKNCPLQRAMFDLPTDTTVFTCDIEYGDDGNLTGDLDPEVTGKAVYRFSDECRIVGMAYQDKLVKISGIDQACYKLIRTWYLSDWCSGEPDYNNWWFDEPYSGRTIQHIQNIIVRDTTAPVCLLVPLKSPIIQTGGCDYDFSIPVLVEDPCGVESYEWTLLKEPGILFKYGGDELNRPEKERFDIVIPGLTDGTYTLKVRIKDACGNESICSYLFEVRVVQKPKAICISELTASLTPMDFDGDDQIDSASVRVWAEEFNRSSEPVCGSTEPLEYRLDLLDGIGDFTWEDDTTFLDLGCQHLGMQFVRMWVIDGKGRTDYCDVILHVQDQNSICTLLTNVVDFKGRIVTEHFKEIQGVSMTVTKPGGQILHQNIYQGGLENVLIPRGESVFVDLSKPDLVVKGVSTADLLLIQKHLQHIRRLSSPYRLRAADANNDGTVSIADLIAIRKVILGIVSEFPNSPAWRFYSPDMSVTPYKLGPMDDDTIMVFTGVKIGDVNLDYNPGEGGYRINDLLEFTVEDSELHLDKEYRLALRANNFRGMEGFQFTLNIDTEAAEILSIEPGSLPGLGDENFGTNSIDKGLIAVSWHNSDQLTSSNGLSFSSDSIVFDVVIRANKEIQLHDVLTINSAITKDEAYDKDLEVKGIGLLFKQPVQRASFTLYQNYPNPFTDVTTIGFDLPEMGEACLTIYDIRGGVINRICDRFQKGYNSISYQHVKEGVNGILFYQLDNDQFSATRRMVLIK